MRYMILIKGDDRTEAGEMPKPELVDEMARFHEQLQAAGVLVDASGLQSTAKGFRIRHEGDRRSVIDGPFSETKELLAGYTIIDVPSRDDAVSWAKRFPNPRGEGQPCEIEVRLMFELDDFEASEGVERFRRMEAERPR